MNFFSHLECSVTGKRYEADKPRNLSDDGAPLLARYDLTAAREALSRDKLPLVSSMWRYSALLPVRDPQHIVTLGEGMTPLVATCRLGKRLGAADLWLKDDGINPTGSFKARGQSAALSMCRAYGITKVSIPSAGNAGGACANYASAAGIESYVFMPKDVPQSNFLECMASGANLTLVDGLISDCGRIVAERSPREGWFEVSTLKEPYRIEGKKTMGFEIAEQFGWELPDAILYPAGGGVGLIGMWKAFDELEALGWIGSKRPKLIAVQAEGCQPVVRAFQNGDDVSEMWKDAYTVAAGLRVPKPLGDRLMLKAIRQTGGVAIAITDQEMLDAGIELATEEGIFAAPEGGACVAAVRKLLSDGVLKASERIVIYNTGAGTKYLEAYSTRFPRRFATEADKLGGLITPR